MSGILGTFSSDLFSASIAIQEGLACRFLASLLAKPFAILTGLAGSGKTKLAQALAYWLTPDEQSYAVVAVGADWSSSANILGYHDQLNNTYIKTPALKVFLHAEAHPDTPCFLILDEMNLSHVERYFADMLSAIESGEPVTLHGQQNEIDGVPHQTKLPPNLFIIGTVNVDETTYLFSPKVLDRANVIEFRASRDDMAAYLSGGASTVQLSALRENDTGKGAGFGKSFVDAAQQTDPPLSDEVRQAMSAELLLLFETLQKHNTEFGFRVAKEISRFISFYGQLLGSEVNTESWFTAAMDAAIMQKLLPKLNGSRAKLSGVLAQLHTLCCDVDRPNIGADGVYDFSDAPGMVLKAKWDKAEEIDGGLTNSANVRYPLSAEKITRMWQALQANGFVSFAEA